MENNFAKQRFKFLIARFKTKEGRFHYLIGTPIFAFLVKVYYEVIYNFFNAIFKAFLIVPYVGAFIQFYFTLISVGLVLTFLGIPLTLILHNIYDWVVKSLR